MASPSGADFLQAVHDGARRHLRKSGGRVASLAADLLLLACGVRVAVLWDFWPLLDADASDDFVAPSGVSPLALRGLLDELRSSASGGGSLAGAAQLGLLAVGPSYFLVHRAALAAKLERELARTSGPPLGDIELVAVDAALPNPRPCSEAERARLAARLSDVCGAALVAALTSPRYDAPLRAECEGSLLVAVHGWLLEYPVVYALLATLADGSPDGGGGGGASGGASEGGGGASGGGSCLGGRPLSLCRLTAQGPSTGGAAGKPHLLCSFTLPGCDDARSRPSVAEWWATMRSRLASEDARACWTDARLEIETVVHDRVVL